MRDRWGGMLTGTAVAALFFCGDPAAAGPGMGGGALQRSGGGGKDRQDKENNNKEKEEKEKKKEKEEAKHPTRHFKGYFLCACAQMADRGPYGKEFDKGKHDLCCDESLPVFFKPTKEVVASAEEDGPPQEKEVDLVFVVAGVRLTKWEIEKVPDSVTKKLLGTNAVLEVKCEVFDPGKDKTVSVVVFQKIGDLWERKKEKKDKDKGGREYGLFGRE